jgi:hypothetical protein
MPLTACISLYLVVYQTGFGSVFWPYASQLLSPPGFSLASLVLWSCVLFMATCTNLMFEFFTVPYTFFGFSAITFLGAFVFIIFMKETKGVSKDDIPLLFLPK